MKKANTFSLSAISLSTSSTLWGSPATGMTVGGGVRGREFESAFVTSIVSSSFASVETIADLSWLFRVCVFGWHAILPLRLGTVAAFLLRISWYKCRQFSLVPRSWKVHILLFRSPTLQPIGSIARCSVGGICRCSCGKVFFCDGLAVVSFSLQPDTISFIQKIWTHSVAVALVVPLAQVL